MSGYSRGGLWTNAEDEILKAAVAKYGLTQWSRCSSLLNRKTAKQCKARWNNWLSPNVKKSDWSPKEDEKLLHMAKILPNQWQTIAPLVGRTPNQCIERYQRLLDDIDEGIASSSVNAEALAPTGPKLNLNDDEFSNLPETKPARPDAIDMDDDEREMISEARARLANTQGKKAKRKQRERLLAQSRRVALLQKRRELKNAGFSGKASLTSRSQKKKNATAMDYNADIPFEHKPEAVIYDVKEEEEKDKRDREKFQQSIAKPDFSNEKDQKFKKRKKDDKKQSSIIIAPQDTVDNDDNEVISKRRKLELPAPKFESVQDGKLKAKQLDAELQKIANEEGLTLDNVKERAEEDDSWLRTKLLESSDDRIRKLGNDLKSFHGLQSTLLEKNKTELELSEEYEFKEQEKLKQKKQNRKIAEANAKKAEAKRLKKIAQTLRKKFAQLPPPKNDFEIGIDDSSEEEEDIDERQRQQQQRVSQKLSPKDDLNLVEDLGEIRKQRLKEQEKDRIQRLKLRSQAVQLGLPLPLINFKTKILKKLSRDPIIKDNSLQKVLDQQMVDLAVSDYLKSEYNGDPRDLELDPSLLDDIVKDLDKASRENALALVEQELQKMDAVYKDKVLAKISALVSSKSYALPGFDETLSAKSANELAKTLVSQIRFASSRASKLENKLSKSISNDMY